MSLGQILERPEGLRFDCWRDQEVQASYCRDQDVSGLATGKSSYQRDMFVRMHLLCTRQLGDQWTQSQLLSRPSV